MKVPGGSVLIMTDNNFLKAIGKVTTGDVHTITSGTMTTGTVTTIATKR